MSDFFSDIPDAPKPRFDKTSPGGSFGAPRPYGGHTGADFAWPEGERVGVPKPGRVRFAGKRSGYGNRVEVEHDDGTVTTYSHLSMIDVRPDDDLDEGSLIGAVGSTGGNYGKHLHYEVLKGGMKVNPLQTGLAPVRGASEVKLRAGFFADVPNAQPAIAVPPPPVRPDIAPPLPTPVMAEAPAADFFSDIPDVSSSAPTPPSQGEAAGTPQAGPPTPAIKVEAPQPNLGYVDESQERPEDFASLQPRTPKIDPRTEAGRAQRDVRLKAEKEGGALYRVPVSGGIKQAVETIAKDTDIPPEFVESWLGRGGFIESSPTGFATVPAEWIGRMKQDYRASLSLPQRAVRNVSEVLSTHSPGEVLTGVGGEATAGTLRGLDLATRPIQGASAAFWAKVKGADNVQAVQTAWEEFRGENPELAKNIIAEALRNSDRLKEINPRLPGLAGFLAEMVADPANVVPGGLIAKGATRLGRVGRAGGRIARLAEGLRDIGVYEPDIPREAFKAAGDPSVLGDLTRRTVPEASMESLPDIPVSTLEAPRVVRNRPQTAAGVSEAVQTPERSTTVTQAQAPTTTETVILHSNPRIDGGRVIGSTSDGRLRVENNEGGVSIVQHPRKGGNREAALVRREVVDATAEQPQSGAAVLGEVGVSEAAVRPAAEGAPSNNRALGEAGRVGEAPLPRLQRDDAQAASALAEGDAAPQVLTVPVPERAKGTGFGKGLTRNYQAGMNRAEITFGSLEQRDLYDAYSQLRGKVRNESQAAAKARVDKAQANLDRLSRVLNVPREQLMKLAGDVYDDVRAQMRGVKDGETRAITDNVRPAKIEAPTLDRLSAPVPGPRAFRAQMKSKFNLSDEQADAVTEIADARARAWARENGKQASDYYVERFGGIERGGEAGKGALNQVIGQSGSARLRDHTRRLNLDVAREMETAGRDAGAIRLATGWERGADGKWRNEIEDASFVDTKSRAKTDEFYGELKRGMDKEGVDFKDYEAQLAFIEKHGLQAEYDALGETLRADLARMVDRSPVGFKNWHQNFVHKNNRIPTLADIFPDAPALEAYPKLRDINVQVRPMEPGHQGSFNGHTIFLANDVGDPRSTLHHEMQHAIQRIEGFAQGGSPEQFARTDAVAEYAWYRELKRHKDKSPQADLSALENAASHEYRANDMADLLPPVSVRDRVLQNFHDRDYVERIKAIATKSRKVGEKPEEIYQRLGGEVEARNVQSRLYMTPEARKRMSLAETEDVSRESQILLGVTDSSDILRQENKAAVEFMSDGRAILRAFQKADVSSAWHEMAHVFRRDLPENLLKDAEEAIGVKGGKWTVPDEEKFARGFERYLKDGYSPSEKLQRVFEAAKQWLTEIYGAVRGKNHPLTFKPNEKLVAVFDQMLDAAPKGDYGQLTHALFKSGFAGDAQVRRRLGLAEGATADDFRRAVARATGKPRSSHASPEDLVAWADAQRLDVEARAKLDDAVGKYRETIKKPTDYEQTGIRKSRIDTQTHSLSEAVRRSGGIRLDKTGANSGEVARLSNRETGTTGIINRNAALNAEAMAEHMRELGYPASRDPNEFLDQLEADLRGERIYSHEREIDWEAEYRRENPDDSTEALEAFVMTEQGGILFDKVDEGTASRAEVTEFRRLAGEAGVHPEHVKAVVARGEKAKAEGVSNPAGGKPTDDFDFGDDSLDDTDKPSFLYQSAHKPEQLGFVSEGLTQQDARPGQTKPKLDDARTDAAKKALGAEAYARLSALKDSPAARLASEIEKRVTPQNAQNAPDVMAALSKLAELKRTKQTVDDYLNQGSLFGDRELTPAQERILSALDKNPRKVMDEAFPAAQKPTQDVLFQSDNAAASRRQRAYRALLEAKGQGSLAPDLKVPPPKLTTGQQVARYTGVFRSLKSSWDLSAAGRQAAMYTVTHPAKATRLFFGKQLTSLKETNYDTFVSELAKHPRARQMKDAELYLASQAGKDPKSVEEAFPTDLAGRIPLIGRGVKASERAYVTFLDAARADWFVQLARQAEDAAKAEGRNLSTDDFRSIATVINRATGRGSLGRGAINDAAPLLNSIFFAPRYTVSRVQVLDPRIYARLPKGARQTAIRQAVQYYGTLATTAALLSYMGLEVGTDPETAEFMKLKVGDTRYDLTAGQGQYVTLAARLHRNFQNRREGKADPFGNDAASNLARWARYKLAPLPAFAVNVAKGRDAVGQPTSLAKESVEAISPIFMKDMYEAFQREGLLGVAKESPAFVGIGVNTYKPRAGGSGAASGITVPPPPTKKGARKGAGAY